MVNPDEEVSEGWTSPHGIFRHAMVTAVNSRIFSSRAGPSPRPHQATNHPPSAHRLPVYLSECLTAAPRCLRTPGWHTHRRCTHMPAPSGCAWMPIWMCTHQASRRPGLSWSRAPRGHRANSHPLVLVKRSRTLWPLLTPAHHVLCLPLPVEDFT